jgi:hypothetical protein
MTKNILTALLAAVTIAGCVGMLGVAMDLEDAYHARQSEAERKLQTMDAAERRIEQALKAGKAAK